MPVRVAIVDDDVWVRTGRAQVLSQDPRIEVAAALGHAEALDQPRLWDGVDVALVDAWDHRAGFDRFPGVGVVRAIRRHCLSPLTIIVVTGHVVNEMLRVRMADAGADLFYGHEDVSDPEALVAVVLGARQDRSAPLGGGGGRAPHPDAALDWIRDHELEPAFSGDPQKLIPFSRRTVSHIRREVVARAGLGSPDRMAPWRQVVAFINRARGVELRRPDAPGSPPDRD